MSKADCKLNKCLLVRVCWIFRPFNKLDLHASNCSTSPLSSTWLLRLWRQDGIDSGWSLWTLTSDWLVGQWHVWWQAGCKHNHVHVAIMSEEVRLKLQKHTGREKERCGNKRLDWDENQWERRIRLTEKAWATRAWNKLSSCECIGRIELNSHWWGCICAHVTYYSTHGYCSTFIKKFGAENSFLLLPCVPGDATVAQQSCITCL